MDTREENKNSMVLSYLELRRIIGILSTSLPFILAIGGMILFNKPLQRSLSYYYHTGMGDVLVGILCVVGFFMYSYKGYNQKENILGHLCCVFTIGAALFPAEPESLTTMDCPAITEILIDKGCPATEIPTATDYLLGNIHLIFSALLFATLIYISLFLFTKSDKAVSDMPKKKQQRNKVYKACGYTMAICMVLIIIHHFVDEETEKFLSSYYSFFWLESISIIAFGVSWLTKGQVILKDEV